MPACPTLTVQGPAAIVISQTAGYPGGPMSGSDTNWLDDDTGPKGEVMHVDVDGYEGPLDLLLELARRQKVDLANVSILALAEQYLAFIDKVRERRIDVAADYLVMAAWLAYLKSRLMVPQTVSEDEPSGEMMAALLQFRLKRLEAMWEASEKLINRPRLGRQVFARGMPEPIVVQKNQLWEASLYDLLKAYSIQRERSIPQDYVLSQRKVWSLSEARDILQRLLGEAMEWVSLDAYITQYMQSPAERATVMASSFSASLEMAREGMLELRQTSAFGPILMRSRADKSEPKDANE
jgi:segregation and condensation protein A